MRKPLFLLSWLALSLGPLDGVQAQPDGRRNDRGRDEQGQADRRDGRSPAAQRAERGERGERSERGRGPQARPPQHAQPGRDRPPIPLLYRDPGRHDGRNGDRDEGRSNERGAGPDHRFYRGQQLPRSYRTRQYVIDDWRGHRLSAPPRGDQWVQVGGDYVLVAITTGLILQLLLSP